MAEGPPNHDHPKEEGREPPPQERLLRKTVTTRVIVVVLLACGFVAAAVAVIYLLLNSPSPPPKHPPATSSSTPLVTVSATSQQSSAVPTATLPNSLIPMGAACKWAYPGQATGAVSGSGYSIVCLGAGGEVLGGFSGSHSLNAWCMDPSHTGGADLPDPQLANGTWACTGGTSTGQTAATSQPTATASPHSSGGQGNQPTPTVGPGSSGGQGNQPPPTSPSSHGGPASVPIPMGAACKWAYAGQATGAVSGSGYSIVCLGAGGEVLGGFSGSHSLNAWCMDPSHTGGADLPDPQLANGTWVCTGSGSAGQSVATSLPTSAASPSSHGGPASVPIPMGAACKWAYAGQATGAVSGSGYSIVCLGAGGEVLGGFSGSHSLNAWCMDPSHTGDKSLPNPALVNGEWLCTA